MSSLPTAHGAGWHFSAKRAMARARHAPRPHAARRPEGGELRGVGPKEPRQAPGLAKEPLEHPVLENVGA
eukprot:4794004-Lingulodinium_polyedra.AAC.1